MSLGPCLLSQAGGGRCFQTLRPGLTADQKCHFTYRLIQGSEYRNGSLPDNIHIYDRVPTIRVLKKADLFVWWHE